MTTGKRNNEISSIILGKRLRTKSPEISSFSLKYEIQNVL